MVLLAFLTAFTLHLLLFSYAPLISPLITEMGISHAQAGAAFSICILAVIMMRVPWGFLIDRIGFAKAIKIAMLLISIFGILRSFSLNYEMLLVFQFFLGVGFAAVLPCLSKLVSVWAGRKVGSASGIYVAGFPAGEATAFTLTAYLLLLFGNWRFSLLIFGFWSLLLLFLWLIFGKEPSESRLEVTLDSRTSFGANFMELIRLREVWILTGLCVLSMGAYDTLLTWLPKILEFRGFRLSAMWPLASMLPLGFLVSGLSIGFASDRVRSKKALLTVLGAAGGSVTPLISFSSGILLPLTIFSVGFCTTGIITLILIMPIELPRTRSRVGSTVGLVSSIGNAGPFLFPILLGYIMDIGGSIFLPMLMLSVIIGIAAILSLCIR